MCCGTRRNSKIWMSPCLALSSARAASTNVRRGLLVVLGDVASIEPQHVRSGEAAALYIRLAKTQFGKPCPIGPAIENPDRVCFGHDACRRHPVARHP